MNIHTPNPAETQVASSRQQRATARIQFVLQSPQSAFAVQACVELLNLANRFSQREFYITQVHHDFLNAFEGDLNRPGNTVILFGNIEDTWPLDAETQKLLRVQLPCTARVGLVGGASLIAAKLRCLRGRTVSVHPNMVKAASEEGICVRAGDEPVYRDGPVFSAIGGLAAPEMIAAMIAEDLGTFLSEQVMDYVGLKAHGTGARTQQGNHYFQRAGGDVFLMQAVSIMVENIENPVSARHLAKTLKISPRQLERMFRGRLGESPMEAYRNLRLEHADLLLRYSDLPIIEVSIASGFGSISLLSQRYLERFGRKPFETRTLRYGYQD